MKTGLTEEYARTLLDYRAETGVFVWRVDRGTNKTKGAVAGHINKRGRKVICIDGFLHYAHRLAWLIVHDTWPDGEIDHIDGNPSNNAITNLRNVSRNINQQNARKPHRDNRSGLLGVYAKDGKWRATIFVDRKRHYLGVFGTPELAHAAYLLAKRRLHGGCTT